MFRSLATSNKKRLGGLLLILALVTSGFGPGSARQIGPTAVQAASGFQEMSPLLSIAAIAAGTLHTCALTASGGVKCWGWNSDGQLGDGTTTYRLTPVNVIGLTSGVTAIAASYAHTCALTAGGEVKCWGDNGNGQLGDGTTTARLTPVNVIGLTSGVTAIAVGDYHTCALTAGGGVKCWGWNYNGQLGDGTTTERHTPVNVSGLTSGVSAIENGGSHTCALTAGGGVKCWGYNWIGQLGDCTTTERHTPVNVSGLANGISAITAGEFHTCALTAGGVVKCWGNNGSGQLGDGTTAARPTPVDVIGLTDQVSAITVGEYHTCARTVVGGVKCWGDNMYGGLGDGTTTERHTPVDVSGLTSGVSAITAGEYHTCTLTVGGGVKCWGYNYWGQLGDGTRTERHTPVDVVGSSPPSVASITRADTNPTHAASVHFTVTFSSAVTGVDVTDFNLTVTGITGASVTGVNGSGTTYTGTVGTGSGSGTLRLDVTDDDSIVDADSNPLGGVGAGNGNFTTGETYTVNKTFQFIYLPLVIR